MYVDDACSIPTVYLDMVNQFLHGKTDLPISPPASGDENENDQHYQYDAFRSHNYLQNGLSYIAEPTTYEMYLNPPLRHTRPYTPYKRISHFREHLNRLLFSQFIYISPLCLADVSSFFMTECNPCDPHIYRKIHAFLKKKGYSKYVEHIHYLISSNTKRSLDIKPQDHEMLTMAFTQLDFVFQQHKSVGRKNLISYHVIVQLFLFLFHYHPHYYLPTIKNPTLRVKYYDLGYYYLTQTQIFPRLMHLFKKRRQLCTKCCSQSYMFDRELVEMFRYVYGNVEKKIA
jgi:Poxvirus Late Transcription Factor VLTF3 like